LLTKKNLSDDKYQNSLLLLRAKILSEQAMAYREIVSLASPLLTNTPIAEELLPSRKNLVILNLSAWHTLL
jgi:hypothetical protein